jgi:serine/threonine protein kinase
VGSLVLEWPGLHGSLHCERCGPQLAASWLSTCALQMPFPDERATRGGALNTDLLRHVSPRAVELLLSMLQRLPEARCSAAQALDSAWIVEGAHSTCEQESRGYTPPIPGAPTPLDVGIVQRMSRYARYSKVKQRLLLRLADSCSDRELIDLQRQFQRMDTSHSGTLSASEVSSALREFKTGSSGQRVYTDDDISQARHSLSLRTLLVCRPTVVSAPMLGVLVRLLARFDGARLSKLPAERGYKQAGKRMRTAEVHTNHTACR